MNIETQLGVDRAYTTALNSMREDKFGDALRMLEFVVGTDSKNLILNRTYAFPLKVSLIRGI